MSEVDLFMSAFYKIHARGETPTPGKLNLEMHGRDGDHTINGRLSPLRIELLEKEGYVKTRDGRWRPNTDIPGETPSTGDWT